jgi:hypothetical protein
MEFRRLSSPVKYSFHLPEGFQAPFMPTFQPGSLKSDTFGDNPHDIRNLILIFNLYPDASFHNQMPCRNLQHNAKKSGNKKIHAEPLSAILYYRLEVLKV